MGGAAGHMNHPFDLSWVNDGNDLLDFFERAKLYVDKAGAGSVKIDGVNVSFKVVEQGGIHQFAVDRGSLKPIDIEGITIGRVDDRFPEGHGMRPAIKTLLTILNKSLGDIKSELVSLGMWDNPSMFLNTEYVEGTTNVTEYDENFLAIHGLNQFYQKVAKSGPSKGNVRPGLPRPEGNKAPSVEVSYNPSVMDKLIKKLNVIANEHGFQVYGSVPTERIADSDIDYSTALSEPFTVRVSDDREITKSLSEWLSEAYNPRYKAVTLKNGKRTHPFHKELYKAILDGSTPIVDLIEDADAEAAIYGAVIMHATRILGNAVLNGLTSPMGDVVNHEGVVLRDDKLFGANPVKITGDFILGGMGSAFQADTYLNEDEGLGIEDENDVTIDLDVVDDESDDPVVDADFPKTVAIVPGAFKPPHKGHLGMVRKYLAGHGMDVPKADEVVVLVSNPTKSGRPIEGLPGGTLTPEQSMAIWQLLLAGMPGVRVEASSHASPLTAAYESIGENSEFPDGTKIILGASTKDDDWRRWAGAEKYLKPGLSLVNPEQSAVVPNTHEPGYVRLLKQSGVYDSMPSVRKGKNPDEYHASDMRYLIELVIEDRNSIARKLLESFVGEGNVEGLLSALMVNSELSEVSGMAVGAMAGPGAAAPKRRQKKTRKENKDLSTVDEVMRLIMERGIMR